MKFSTRLRLPLLIITTLLLTHFSLIKADTEDIDDADDLQTNSNPPKVESNTQRPSKAQLNGQTDDKDSDADIEINFLQTKSTSKNQLKNSSQAASQSQNQLKNRLKSRNKGKNSNQLLSDGQDDEIDEKGRSNKFVPYFKVPASVQNNKTYRDKEAQFKENLKSYLQNSKKFRTGNTEGYIEKFNRRKYVQPGEDLFLGFLKYMSETASLIQQKIAKDKRNTDPYRFQ